MQFKKGVVQSKGAVFVYRALGSLYGAISSPYGPFAIVLSQSPGFNCICPFSRSETWVPKRGGLKPAGKRQESTTFLQRSFFDVAVQFFVCCSAAFGPNDFRTAEKPMLQCSFCSAALRKLQRSFRFRLWHVAGAGFRGVGFRTC